MIRFEKFQGRLNLIYEGELDSGEWVAKELELNGSVRIARAFYFLKEDLVQKADEPIENDDFGDDDNTEGAYTFTLGTLTSGYFKISGDRLGIDHDIYLAADLPVRDRTFIASRNISIFRQIGRVTAQDIYIGGDELTAMPVSAFEKLLKSFPNSTELDHYANAKVARVLREYFETTTPAEKKLEDFLSKRGSETKIQDLPALYRFEVEKYEFIRDKISELLEDEGSFGENEWRDLMLQFILLIFPKYICVLRNVLIKDFYTSSKAPKNRYLDIALIDANGHIDIIEIKKPFQNCLVSDGDYRGNFTPRRELSGTIMQAEKYLFHLSKWGVAGEQDINKRQAPNLPTGLVVKITNPKAIVIAGRSNNLSTQQLFDFELIKRKYGNIIDILSYDDLLNRLSSIVEKFSQAV
jgi:hypothetical protein